MKRIIVACGSGVATSQTIASKVNTLFENAGVTNAFVDAVDIKNLEIEMRSCIAYIHIVPVVEKYPVPTINGIAFLTGINQDEEFEKLLEILKGGN